MFAGIKWYEIYFELKYLFYFFTILTHFHFFRKAFANPKKFAAIIGVPVWIVSNIATLLAVINTKNADIDPDEFEKFCDDHLEKWYDSPYSWNRHNPTVRKLICAVYFVHFVLTLKFTKIT